MAMRYFRKVQKIHQQLVTVRGEDTFGMKLDTKNRQVLVGQCHQFPVIRCPCDKWIGVGSKQRMRHISDG